MTLHIRPPTRSVPWLWLVLAGCSTLSANLDAGAYDAGRDARPDGGVQGFDGGIVAEPDAGEWIHYTLRADKVPTGAFQRLDDGGFEFEVLDGGYHEFRARQPFRAFTHSYPFTQVSLEEVGPLHVSVFIVDGGARACDQFQNPSSIRIGRFDVVSRNASCVIAIDSPPQCPGDLVSGTFSGLLIDRTTGASLPVVDGAFSVRVSFVAHGAPNPPNCVCVPGSSTTNPLCG